MDGRPYLALKHPLRLLRHHGSFFASELALFAVDFGRRVLDPHPIDSRPMLPPCPAAAAARPRAAAPLSAADPALSAVRHDLQRSLR